MKKPFILFLCLIGIFAILFSPAAVISGMDKNVFTLRAEQLAARYRGKITLWHISGVVDGSLLTPVAGQFEKDNANVFIDYRVMTQESAQKLFDDGVFPDIISYPLGSVSCDFYKLPTKNLLLKSGKSLPYAVDTYSLFCNSDIFSDGEVDFPTNKMDISNFMWAMSKLSIDKKKGKKTTHIYPLTIAKTTGISAATLSFLNLPVAEEFAAYPQGIPVGSPLSKYDIDFSGEAEFLAGRAAMLVAPTSRGKYFADTSLLPISEFAFTDYCDLVQYIGVIDTDTKKTAMCIKFCDRLFTENFCKKLAEFGLLSAVRGNISAQSADLAVLSELSIPDSDFLYKNREKAESAARAAIADDLKALEELSLLLGVNLKNA